MDTKLAQREVNRLTQSVEMHLQSGEWNDEFFGTRYIGAEVEIGMDPDSGALYARYCHGHCPDGVEPTFYEDSLATFSARKLLAAYESSQKAMGK